MIDASKDVCKGETAMPSTSTPIHKSVICWEAAIVNIQEFKTISNQANHGSSSNAEHQSG
jgi:hypothetical protein